MAYVTTTADGTNLIARELDGPDERLLTEVPGFAYFAYAPRGDRIAVMKSATPGPSADGRLAIIETSSGRETILPHDDVIAFFWAPNGNRIAYLVPARPDGEQGLELDPVFAREPRLFYAELRVVDVRRGNSWRVVQFPLSEGFLRLHLPFFDQYLRSTIDLVTQQPLPHLRRAHRRGRTRHLRVCRPAVRCVRSSWPPATSPSGRVEYRTESSGAARSLRRRPAAPALPAVAAATPSGFPACWARGWRSPAWVLSELCSNRFSASAINSAWWSRSSLSVRSCRSTHMRRSAACASRSATDPPVESRPVRQSTTGGPK